MSEPSLFRAGWVHVKQYAPSVMAAGAMYKGLLQIVGGLKYPVTDLTMRVANAIFMRAVRDHLPLPNDYGGVPWQYHASIIAEGVILAVVGTFVGLWVNARSKRQPAPLPKQSPHQSEG